MTPGSAGSLLRAEALLEGLHGLLGLVLVEVGLPQKKPELEALGVLLDPALEHLGGLEGLPLGEVKPRGCLPGVLAGRVGRHDLGHDVDGGGLAPLVPVEIGQVELVGRLVRLKLDHLLQLGLGLVHALGVGV